MWVIWKTQQLRGQGPMWAVAPKPLTGYYLRLVLLQDFNRGILSETLRAGECLEDRGVYSRIILRGILKNRMGGRGLN